MTASAPLFIPIAFAMKLVISGINTAIIAKQNKLHQKTKPVNVRAPPLNRSTTRDSAKSRNPVNIICVIVIFIDLSQESNN